MATPILTFTSGQDYLEAERKAFEKHAYYKGEVFAMSEASVAHNKIFSKLFGELTIKLKGKNYMPYGSDLRIHIPLFNRYFSRKIYPQCRQ